MIPKIIHYCWFGNNTKSKEVQRCIDTWRIKCPDYKIIEWNESNFDLNLSNYALEAYKAKKWAFVTDYVRLYVLYKYGGIYMDTDVEVVKSLDPLLVYNAFSGYESNEHISTGTIGAVKENEWIKKLLDDYESRSFIKENGRMDLTTNVITITQLTLEKYELKLDGKTKKIGNNMIILPFDYLCAKSFATGKVTVSDNTYTIHNFNGSWLTASEKKRVNLCNNISKYTGEKIAKIISGIIYYTSLEGVQKICHALFKR